MAIAPIVIDLLVKGAPQVQQSFKGVQDAAARAERAIARETERSERFKQNIRERSATMAGRLAAKQAAEEKRIHERGIRETERVEREKTRAAEKAARDQARVHERAAREEERVVQRSQENIRRIRERSAAMAGQFAKQQAALEERLAKEAAASRAKFATGLVGAAGRGVVAGGQRVANVATGLATTAAQLGGGFSIADSVMKEKDLRKQAAVLSANTILSRAGQPGSDPSVGGAMSTDQILGKAKAVGIEQNIDPAEVLRGYDEIKKLTGNVEKATQVMPAIAKLSTATGGDLSEMSGLAGNILAANPNIDNAALEGQMRIFARQGVVGGVEVADFAKYGSRITAGASMYGGDKEKNEATLGAMAQMARQYGSAGTAAEATLGSLRFSTDIAKHADSLKDAGINVSDGKGNLKDAQSVLLEMLDKTNGDVTKMAGLGLGERGVKPLEGVANIYKNAGGGQKGKDAVKAEFAKYTTGVSKDEIDAANKRVLAEQQTEIEMQKLRIAVGEQLLPEFVKMIPAIRDLVPPLLDAARVGIPAFTELMKAVAEFVKAHKGEIQWLAQHPIGSLVAFELTKSFAAAALPTLLQSLMRSAFGAATGGGAGGAGAAGGAAGPGLIAAGVAAQAYGTYDLIKGTRGAIKEGQAQGTDIAARIAAGDPTAQAELDKAKADSSGVHQSGAYLDRAMRAVTFLTNPFGAVGQLAGDAAMKEGGLKTSDEHAKKTLRANEIVDTVALQKATTDAIANGVREGVRQGNSGPNGAGRDTPIIDR
jgi:hypothetical protein